MPSFLQQTSVPHAARRRQSLPLSAARVRDARNAGLSEFGLFLASFGVVVALAWSLLG